MADRIRVPLSHAPQKHWNDHVTVPESLRHPLTVLMNLHGKAKKLSNEGKFDEFVCASTFLESKMQARCTAERREVQLQQQREHARRKKEEDAQAAAAAATMCARKIVAQRRGRAARVATRVAARAAQ